MKKNRAVLIADMMSFYASCEKARHPEYQDKPLVVAGDPARRSGIVLAACPLAKQYGVTTAERLGEALGKCPDLIVARPHMEYYINVSLHITGILERYTDLVEVYSCDELFADVTHSVALFGTPEEIAKRIQSDIMAETGVYARVAISDNKVMSKLALDLVAKKIEGGIFRLYRKDMEQHIWKHPVNKMWMCGSRMTRHFYKMGIHTIGDLAKTPLPRLTKRWGVNGEVLWRIANGIDYSPVTPGTFDGNQVNIGNGMVLPRDYGKLDEIDVILLELSSQVCRRARGKGLMGQVVSVGCQGADWDHPTGFHRQQKMADPTNLSREVFECAKKLFRTHWDGQPVRRLSVALSGLSSDSVQQLTLFSQQREKESKLEQAMDLIKDRFGEATVLRASSLTPAGQARDRAGKIGGHYK